MSTYGNERCTIRNAGEDIQLPCSILELRRSFLLRDGDEFISDAGRWQIRWDDEAGTLSHSISHSMRPPAIPPPDSDPDLRDNELNVVPSEPAPSASAELLSPLATSLLSPNAHNNMSSPPKPSKVTKSSMHEIEADDAATDTDTGDLDKTIEVMNHVAKSTALHKTSSNTPSNVSKQVQKPDALSDDKENTVQPNRLGNDLEVDETLVTGSGQINKRQIPPVRATVRVSAAHDSPLGATETSTTNLSVKTTDRKRKIEEEAGRRAREKKRRTAGPVVNQETVAEGSENQKAIGKEDSTAGDRTDVATHGHHEMTTHKPRTRPRKRSSATPGTPGEASRTKLETRTPTRSTGSRSTKQRSQALSTLPDAYEGSLEPKVYFASNTTVDGKKTILKTFQELGGVKVTNINEANIFCVKDNELVKSSSLLQAILHGMHIVNEEWLIGTHQARAFVDPAQFVPSDPDHELEWSFEISSAVKRGRDGFPRLLEGITVWLTVRLKQSLSNKIIRDLSNVASGLGAADIKHGIPKTRVQRERMTDLVIGIEQDPQATEVGHLGHKLYEKEILTMAVLRGVLELESTDFMVKGMVKEECDE